MAQTSKDHQDSAIALGPMRITLAAALIAGLLPSHASAQSISLFSGQTPGNPVEADTSAVTLGLKFYSTQAGTISGIRFYRGAKNTSGYTVRLYSASGTLLAQATLTKDSCVVPCWEQANFASPVSIAANTTYVASYYTSNGRYADGYYGLSGGASSGPLTAPADSVAGGNGVYYYGKGFPSQTWQASNYYVDIAFTPSAPALTVSFNPPNPSIPSDTPPNTVVAKVIATWSDGSPFTGTLGFGPPYSNDGGVFALSGTNVIVDPSGPGVSSDANTAQNITVVATQ